MEKFNSRLRIVYRNLPLSRHNYAVSAALAAESAHSQGKFWQIHDALFKASPYLDNQKIAMILSEQNLNPHRILIEQNSVARKRVAEDMAFVKKWHVEGTPSFILICPDGKVYLLSSINQINDIISH